MKRRTWLGASVGVVAAAAGAGWAWRRQMPTPANGAVASAPPGAAAPADLWTLQFEQPGGGDLRLASLRGKPLLLNFWATWCPPCVKEMPLLDSFHREQAPRGWQVVGLAVDGPTPVREFLARKPVGFPVGLAGLDGVALTRSLGNAGGQLPFTVVFDREGQIRQRQLGAVDEARLAAWVADMA